MIRKTVLTAAFFLLASAVGVLASFTLPETTHAVQSVPYKMNFQGRLNDSTGTPMAAGTYNMIFRIYSGSSGGSSLWSETHSVYGGTGVIVTSGGLFSVQLGSVVGLPPSIFNNASSLYLEVELPTPATVQCSTNGCASYTEGAMTPRNQIASSPSAINSDLLDGFDSSDFAMATGSAGYIQNQSASPQSASFSINGTGLIQNTSTTAFRVQNTSGAATFNVDTTNNKVTIAGSSLYAGEPIVRWTARTGAADWWYGITYGEGKFVAVGSGANPVMTSPDGKTWTPQSAPADGWWRVAYGGGTFVALSWNGTAMSSPDGVTWTSRTIPDQYWTDVTYGNGKFVAISSDGLVMTSPDGATWTTHSAPYDNWSSVIYGGGTFVAVTNHGTDSVMTSPDGVTWTTQTAPNEWWKDVIYANGSFIAIGSSSMMSTDGVTWTEHATPAGSWSSIAYGDGRYVAVNDNSNLQGMSSVDGINWTTNISPEGYWYDMAYGGGTFAAIGDDTINAISGEALAPLAVGGDFEIQNAAGQAVLNIDSFKNKTNVIGNLNLQQVINPSSPPSVALGASGNVTGTYYYAVTYVTAAGETGPSNISSAISPSSQQVELTNIPVSSSDTVIARNIYRGTTAYASNTYVWAGTIYDNTTTTYTDNRATLWGNGLKIDNTTASLMLNDSLVLQATTNNTAVGVTALNYNQTGTSNTAFGYRALYMNSTGSYNTAVGDSSLTNSTTGWYNTASGYGTLTFNTTGNNNTATGTFSLQHNTSGGANTATGYAALTNNTTGSNNTSTGSSSLTSNTTGGSNTAYGNNALNDNTSGNFNSATGVSSLGSNTTGTGNTAVGFHSLLNNTTGYDNTAVGFNAGYCDYINTAFCTGAALQASTAIGTHAQVTQNNSLVLGSVDRNTKVGIGITSPLNLLSASPIDYQTGTVKRTNGSTTLAGTGTTWTSAMVGDMVVFADGTINTITGFTSATSVTMGTMHGGTTDPGTVAYRFHKVGLQVTSAGSAYVQNNSTTAFKVQNATSSVLTVDTTNSIVSVGSTTAGSSVALFTLGNYNGAGDPSGGVNGATYYNTTLNAFRCYVNGAWTNCAGGGSSLATGNTAGRTSSPTMGALYYDTDTKQLLSYNGTRWVGTQKTAVIVAASNSSQAQKDAADYVATGSNDGSTINSALTAGSGGIVFLQPGTYTLGATSILVPNNTTLAGAGTGSILTYPNNLGSSTFYAIKNTDTTTGTGVVVRNLKISGNRTNQSAGIFNGIYLSGLGGSNQPGATVEGVTVENLYSSSAISSSAIYVGTSPNTTITKNTVNNNVGYAINLNSYNDAVTHNTANNNFIGIHIMATTNTVASSNTTLSNYIGIYVDSSSTSNTLTNNNASSNTAYGISLDGSANAFNGNIASMNGDSGFYISNSSTNTFTGNTTDSNTLYGFYLTGTSANNTVTGNAIATNGTAGIYIAASSNIISSNRLNDNGGSGATSSIYIASGNYNQITSNQISDTAGTGYAMNVVTGTSNILADNIFRGTGATLINDGGVNTVYNAQMKAVGDGFTFRGSANSATAFAVQNASGVAVLTVNTSGPSVTVAGTLNVTTGYQLNGTSGSTTTCSGGQFLQNQVVQGGITTGGSCATTGTVTGTGSNNQIAMFTGSGAIGNSILTQSGTVVTATGTLQATTAVQSASFDTGSATTLALGSTNATAINIGQNTTVASGKSFTIQGDMIVKNSSTVGVSIQNSGGGRVLGVDTFSSATLFGMASTIAGKLTLYNATNSNTVSLQSGVTTSSYTLTLPTAAGGIAGLCLSDLSGAGSLGWASCGGGGGSYYKQVTLTPEYAGAILHASGSNNNGTMTTDYSSGLSAGQGYKHNYYQWTTSQATAQNYDIIVNTALPSDFNSTNEFTTTMWKVWTYVDNTTDAGITMTIYDKDMTACANGVSIKSGSTGWQQITLTDFSANASCDFNANDIITISINMSSKSPATNKVRVGEIQYGYAT